MTTSRASKSGSGGSRLRRAWRRIPRSLRIGLPLLLALAALSPYPELLRWMRPGHTSLMHQRMREAREHDQVLSIQREWLDLEDIDATLVRAVLIAEDQRFFLHDGVDWLALAEELHYQGDGSFEWWDVGDWASVAQALRYYRSHADEVKGRSTITQQLAKNLYFGTERSLTRKVRELVVAKRMEWFLPKERILELYLNVVELGPGVFGVEAAAQAYFSRSAADLSRAQAASLAATLPHPLTSNPDHRPSRMAWRRDLILRRLARGEDAPRPE
ncbi:MAG: biosynthetic peptidoglycan transglycosylase [Gemmatimonadota bacterium]